MLQKYTQQLDQYLGMLVERKPYLSRQHAFNYPIGKRRMPQ